MERRLTYDEYELSLLLEADVGRAREQVVVERVRDRRRRLDRARNDQHPFGLERARRDRGGEVAVAMDDVRERLEVGGRVLRLELDRLARLARHHQVHLDVGDVGERLERSVGIQTPARTRDADDQPPLHGCFFYRNRSGYFARTSAASSRDVCATGGKLS